LFLIRRALEEGLPVLAETPWAPDLDSVSSLLDERAGRPAASPPLLPVSPLRFAADLQLARGIVHAGSLGDPIGFELCLTLPEMAGPATAAGDPISAAALVLEQGWAAMDLARSLFGEAASLQASRIRSTTPAANLEAVEIALRFVNAWTGKVVLTTNRSQAKPCVVRAMGSEASLDIGWQESFYRPKDGERTRIGSGCFGIDSYRRMAEAFAGLALHRSEGWLNDQDLVRTLDLVQAAHMSLGAGLAVEAPRRQRRIVAA
jgi:predicted dehydrogenase